MDLICRVACQNGHIPIARVHDAVFFKSRLGPDLKQELEFKLHDATLNKYWHLSPKQLKRYTPISIDAANEKLMEHEGRAVVFENAADLASRIDSPDLDVNPEDILVLKNIGPKGAPGMPEAGYIPIPMKLARAGVKDIVRISDGRMSGTAFGTIVLHVTPESAIGGPLAQVRNGDRIRLSVKNREISLLISEAELAKRMQENPIISPTAERGYKKLFLDTVTQADQGVDFDFLRAAKMVGKTPSSK